MFLTDLFETKSQWETPAFKAWFGNSKIIDGQGNPLRLYHGTGADIEAFSYDNPRMKKGKLGKGIYLTPSTSKANLMARIRQDKGDGDASIMPLYAKIENPYEIDTEANIPVSGISREKLIQHGYDGIVLKNDQNNPVEIVAFFPNQVKSAIGNQGEFSSSDKINESILLERIDIQTLYKKSYDAIVDVLNQSNTGDNIAKERIENIKSALNNIAHNYASKWKSGIKNAHGYELNKLHPDISLLVTNSKSGASTQFYQIDLISGSKQMMAKIIIYIKAYNFLWNEKIDEFDIEDFAKWVATSFSHEMLHFTQEVGIKTMDQSRRIRIRHANAYSINDNQLDNITDRDRTKYLSSKDEVDAYAANAATDLVNAFGVKGAKKALSDISSHVDKSDAIEKYVRLVKPNRPKAWKRFLLQVGWNIENAFN